MGGAGGSRRSLGDRRRFGLLLEFEFGGGQGKGKGIVSREGTGYLVWFGRAEETRRVGAEEGEGREERRNEYRTRSDRMRMEGREDSLGRKTDAVRCGEVQSSAGAGAGWADQRGCVCGVCPNVSSVVSLPLKQLEQQHEATERSERASDFGSLAPWPAERLAVVGRDGRDGIATWGKGTWEDTASN